MNTKNSVLIVSVFGRSQWLAVALARRGIPTCLLDVTESLGSWIPEEVEGPFGIFQSEKTDKTYFEQLLEDDAPISVTNGFTIWLDSGPVEFKGPTTQHRLDSIGIPDKVVNYLSQSTEATAAQLKEIDFLPFYMKWPIHFAHAWGASEYLPSVQSLNLGSIQSLFSNFMIRMPSRQGHYRSLDWCRRHGVKVIDKASIVDIFLGEGRTIKGIEYSRDNSEKTEILNCEQFVWCLTSEESGVIGAKSLQIFYPHGVLEPEWIWCRYRVRISEGIVREQLPLHVTIIKDLGIPWTHENFLVLIRTGSADLFDVWMKLPNIQRFNKNYLNMHGELLVKNLQDKLVNLRIEIVDYPVGYDSGYSQVGPARNPIYDIETKSKWKTAKYNNLWLNSIEQRSGHGWNAQFQQQSEVLNGIMSWWEKKLAKLRKLKTKEKTKDKAQKSADKGAEL